MDWLYSYSIRRPKTVVVLAFLVTLAIAPGALRLRIRTDGHALVPADAEQVIFDRAIRDEFGVEDPVVVLIRSADPHGIFTRHTVELIHGLTDALRNIPGVRPSDVSSLDTEHNYRVRTGSLKFRTFLEPMPTTRQQLDVLREDIRDIQLYDGTVIAFDDGAAAILVGVPADMQRTEFYTRVQQIVAGLGNTPERIDVLGAPVAEALLGTHILEDLGVPEVVLGQRLAWDEDVGWRIPESLYELRVMLGRQVGLVPVTIGIMMVVFVLCFRSVTAALLPMMEVGACLVVVFGLMGWFNVPVYLTIAVLPVILTAIGVADEIHVFNRYARELRERPERGHLDALRTAMTEMWAPVVKTSVTTAIGFLSFALSPLGPVKAFGVFTAVGIVFCMLWSLSVIPSQLALVSPRRLVRQRAPVPAATPAARAPALERLGRCLARRRWAVLGVVAVAAALAPLGVRRIVIQDSWIDGFAADSAFYKATQSFNQRFLGTHMLLVCVDTQHNSIVGELDLDDLGDHEFMFPGDLVDDPQQLVGRRIHFKRVGSPLEPEPERPPGRRRTRRWEERKTYVASAVRRGDALAITLPRRHAMIKNLLRLSPGEKLAYEITPQRLLLPEVLQRIGELETFIEEHRAQAVGGVIGPADYIATTRFMKSRDQARRSIPETTAEVEVLWGDYRRIRGEERLRQIVDVHFARCLVSVFMTDANFVDTQQLMDDIREYERTHLEPHGISLAFAGDVAVSQTLIGAIVTTQVRSLLVSLVGIMVVTAILSRSLIWGVLCVLPCALAVLFNFAVMGLTGMPLGVATSMFAGMTLGIGVDYAIHLLERYRFSRRRGLGQEASLADALIHTGPAILIDAVAVALGFGIMTLSQVPANARLGGLVVLSIAGCLAATLLVLPALLSLGRRGTARTSTEVVESRPG